MGGSTEAASSSRSWLLTSALSATPSHGTADELILDLEDAVPDDQKEAARVRVIELLKVGRPTWVRINDRGSNHWYLDIETIAPLQSLAGVILAKSESAAQVNETHRALGYRVPIVALIESAVGVEAVSGIAKARGTSQLAFGPSDYCLDIQGNQSEASLLYPRSRLVVASRACRILPPIDGPTADVDAANIGSAARAAYELGFGGKLVLDAAHAPVVNREMQPAQSELAWAKAFLAESSAASTSVMEGSYRPKLARARRILERAASFD